MPTCNFILMTAGPVISQLVWDIFQFNLSFCARYFKQTLRYIKLLASIQNNLILEPFQQEVHPRECGQECNLFQSNTIQNTLRSFQDARTFWYYSLHRALIISQELHGKQRFPPENVSLLSFYGIWPIGKEFQSLNHSLIKEIVSCQNKTNTSASEQDKIQLCQAKQLAWRGLYFKNEIQQLDQLPTRK